jgi:hypothetical protein
MDKPVLRSTLKKLRALPLDHNNHPNVMMAPQEMLDFLAMRAGLKPVHLLGRGFDDPEWIKGAVAIAQKAGLQVIEGPLWDAQVEDHALPDWFREHLEANKQPGNAFYITKTAGHAAAVKRSFDNPPITMDQEASLLGYPPCCVRAHYERDALLNSTFYKMIQRAAKGDVAEMQRLLREDIGVEPETDEEREGIKNATVFIPAPYTSVHMCQACADNQTSPAWQLSSKYEALARLIDRDLAAQVEANQKGVGQ